MGWTSPAVLGLAALAVILSSAFIYVELKAKQPMIDLALFKNRMFFAGNAAGLISFVTMFFALFLMPFYLDKVLALKPYQIGLMMTPFPLAMFVVAPLSGWASDRIGPLYLTTGGLAVVSVALAALSTLDTDTPLWSVAVRSGLMGVGAGLFQSPNNSSVMGTVPPPKLGVAGGVVATVRNVGMVMGVALAVTLFNTRYEYLRRVLPEKMAFVQSLTFVFLTAAVINLLGIAVSAVRGQAASPVRENKT
ncbi:MAG: MFS transporter [Bacillota bacterium]